MSETKNRNHANQPIARFRYGGVSAVVFVNRVQRRDGTTFDAKSVVVQRTYRDSSGEYRSTNSFDPRDLPKAILAMQKAYEFCVSARDPGDDDSV